MIDAVFDIEANRTRLGRAAQGFRDRLRARSISRFEIRRHRHRYHSRHALDGAQHLAPGQNLPVGPAERPGHTRAGRRNGRESGLGNQDRGRRIPGIRQHERFGARMKRPQRRRLGRQICNVHGDASRSYAGEWQTSRARTRRGPSLNGG